MLSETLKTQENRAFRCLVKQCIIEDMRNESIQEEKRMTVKRMLSDGILTLEKIAEYSGLSIDEVKKMKTE